MINYHMHTSTSSDAQATVDEYCRKAKELGFSEICITNHHEIGMALAGDFRYSLTEAQLKDLKNEIASANKRYSPLVVKLGVEIDFQEEYTSHAARFVHEHPFDYVISSIHFLDGIVIADNGRKLPAHVDVKKLYSRYFEELNRMIATQDFDCIGHLDVIRRAAPAIPFEDYEHEIGLIAALLNKHGKGFELNTSGYRHGNGAPYPCYEILKKMHDCGVRKVTVGSDCHRPEQFDSGMKESMMLLKKAGYREVCVFDKRKVRWVDI